MIQLLTLLLIPVEAIMGLLLGGCLLAIFWFWGRMLWERLHG